MIRILVGFLLTLAVAVVVSMSIFSAVKLSSSTTHDIDTRIDTCAEVCAEKCARVFPAAVDPDREVMVGSCINACTARCI